MNYLKLILLFIAVSTLVSAQAKKKVKSKEVNSTDTLMFNIAEYSNKRVEFVEKHIVPGTDSFIIEKSNVWLLTDTNSKN